MAAPGAGSMSRRAQQVVGGLRSLANATSTGGGTSFELGAAYEKFAVQHVVEGTTTEGSIQLQGRIGGSTGWVDLGSAFGPSTAGEITVASSTTPVTDVRVNVATAPGSTDGITAWIAVL